MPALRRHPLIYALALCLAACAGSRPAALAAAHPTPSAAATTPHAAGKRRGLPALGANIEGVAVGIHGAVASAEPHASLVGLEVLRAGGNAVDAAIAVAFALAVTHPSAGNLGGGGFMLVRMHDGQAVAIDYRETAPGAATRDMYLDASGKLTRQSLVGARAAGVAGTVAGLGLAHARFGTRPWAQLVSPAVALARDGHAVDAFHAELLAKAVTRMREAGLPASAAHYLAPDAQPIRAGDVWRQPELARTLAYLAEHGPRSFYAGELADKLAASVRQLGGVWTSADLAAYQAVARIPLRFDYLGHEILTMPPPSAGGIVLRQILFASELLHMRDLPWRSAAAMQLYVEAARRAYSDRATWIADPAFVDVPTAGLTDPSYLRARMADIDGSRATPSAAIAAGSPVREASPQTTHFSVVDDAGNAVSNTYTLNDAFGSLVVVADTGVLLNDEMDDFASQPGTANLYGLVQGERNKIEPGKRMLSSMTPTIVTKTGELRAVLGTPGGSTITTTVAQVVRALVDYGVPLDVAVRAPRVHHQWLPDQVVIEPEVEADIVAGLTALGHKIALYAYGHIGHADCIEVDPATHGFRAVADVTRGSGGAVAY
ncbi:MAG TPA: gamma-glutamyltransferase [Polyangiales bacterium]